MLYEWCSNDWTTSFQMTFGRSVPKLRCYITDCLISTVLYFNWSVEGNWSRVEQLCMPTSLLLCSLWSVKIWKLLFAYYRRFTVICTARISVQYHSMKSCRHWPNVSFALYLHKFHLLYSLLSVISHKTRWLHCPSVYLYAGSQRHIDKQFASQDIHKNLLLDGSETCNHSSFSVHYWN